MSELAPTAVDVLIVGGGMVGASLALENGSSFVLRIRDTGSGIRPADRPDSVVRLPGPCCGFRARSAAVRR